MEHREVDTDPAASGTESAPVVAGFAPPFRRLHLLVLFVVVALGRWSLAFEARVPQLVHDEHAQLAVARVISGAGHWTMADVVSWQPGLGLLLAPIAATFEDPSTMYRMALVLNCLIGAAGAVVFASLVRRILRPGLVPHSFGLLAAAVVTLGPGQIRNSALVWAEPAVFLLLTGVMLCLVEAERSERLVWPIGAVVLASVGYLFHGRLLPVVGVAAVLATWFTWRRSRTAGMVIGAVGTGTFVVVRFVSAIVIGKVWTDPRDVNTAGATLRRLGDPTAVLVELVGQLWYLQAATLTLFGVGVVTLMASAIRRTHLVEPWAARITGLVIGVSVLTSAVFMSGRVERADFPIYGRYNEAVAGLVAVIGLVALWHWARSAPGRFATVAAVGPLGMVVLALVTNAARGDVIRTMPLARVMVTGIAPYVYGTPNDLVEVSLVVTLVAGMVFMALFGLSRRPLLLVAVFGVLTLSGALRSWDVQVQWRGTFAPVAAVEAVDDIVPPGQPIGVELLADPDDGPSTFAGARIEMSLIQFHLPDRVVTPWFQDGPPPEFVFGTANSDTLAGYGAVVWSSPEVGLALWQTEEQP